ncbi:MAG: Re/Si-specific NAD(P)(+) transhydrogenase subunit alpha [Gammaproteobacteria bacterium]|nr:Re/Si-specific NAD(P)(+) transhydrogenase subunit alpha [Gammaproteobacteria bacterium]
MNISVPKETLAGETRVALTPELVKKLTAKGFAIGIEQGAGLAAGFEDAAYVEAGAEMLSGAAAWQGEIVVKVRKPQQDEVAKLKDGAVLIAHLEPCTQDEVIQALLAKQIKAIAMERIPRISRAQSMDSLSSQSNIAGYRAVIEAAAHYGRFMPLMMTSAGSAKPARLVVLGAGVAGLQAIATARRLGADVHAYDVRPETQEQIESLGAKAIVLDLGESGSGEGGYAKELSAEAKAKQQQLLADELAKAHIIITTALIPCRPAPILITEEVVQRMRPGSVIVDLAAANGGNCPLTEKDQVVVKHGVSLVGHTNYPAMVPADSSTFYAGNIKNLLEIMVDKGENGLLLKDLDQDEITKAAQLRAE